MKILPRPAAGILVAASPMGYNKEKAWDKPMPG